MKKILLGALVAAAVAGVVYYFYDTDGFNETVGDLKDKADDAIGKAKESFASQKEAYEEKYS